MDRGGDTSQHQPAVSGTSFVLVGSDDVVASIGRTGFLEGRLLASRPDAPPANIVFLPAMRYDVLAQELTSGLELEGTVLDLSSTAVLVLSLSDTLTAKVHRHRESGRLVQAPPGSERPGRDDAYESVPFNLDETEEALRSIAGMASDSGTALVLYNVSTYTPAEKVNRLRPDEAEPVALTTQRINLLADQLAAELDLLLVDVDLITGELGASGAVTAYAKYSDQAHAEIAESALATLTAIPEVAEVYGAELMRLAVPRHDRRTQHGILLEWSVAAPCRIETGTTLFRVRFDGLVSQLDEAGADQKRRSLQIDVVALQDGYLARTSVAAGEEASVGATVGTVTASDQVEVGDVSQASTFPVGTRLVTG